MTRRRVLVIGLDGATFDIIDPLIEQGQLPQIGKLIREGTSARLLSTLPPVTIPAWPTFMTGKNPGKHGAYDFIVRENGRVRLITSNDIRAATLWEILSHHGAQCVVMNVPGTYPPRPINGVLVSGMMTPTGRQFVHPPEMRQLIDTAAGGYRINARNDLRGEDHIHDILKVASKRTKAFIALLERQAWDFAMLMYRATDEIQHRYWEDERTILECYQRIDDMLKSIIEHSGSGTTVFLVSDHGFQYRQKEFYLDKWLIDNGYMRVKRGTYSLVVAHEALGCLDGRSKYAKERLKDGVGGLTVFQRIGLNRRNLLRWFPTKLWRAMRRFVPRYLVRILPESADSGWEIDMEHSVAITTQLWESTCIQVTNCDQNTKKRVLDRLVSDLESVVDLDGGVRVVRRAYRKNELFQGPYAVSAPDLVLELEEGYSASKGLFAAKHVKQSQFSWGIHHRDGILCASGPEIETAKRLVSKPHLVDMVPTILHCLGLPIPDDLDGQILFDLFLPESVVGASVPEYYRFDWSSSVDEPSSAYTEGEKEQIYDHLRGLGYLE